MQNLYKCTLYRSSCKIESTKTKQTITNNDLVVDLPTKILDENINLNTAPLTIFLHKQNIDKLNSE
jgi:hypothetical protein